jgi:hypothetical protein
MKTAQYGQQFIVVVCFPDSVNWHPIQTFDPDQEQDARATAERYLDFLPSGSQVGIAEIWTYAVKE